MRNNSILDRSAILRHQDRMQNTPSPAGVHLAIFGTEVWRLVLCIILAARLCEVHKLKHHTEIIKRQTGICLGTCKDEMSIGVLFLTIGLEPVAAICPLRHGGVSVSYFECIWMQQLQDYRTFLYFPDFIISLKDDTIWLLWGFVFKDHIDTYI